MIQLKLVILKVRETNMFYLNQNKDVFWKNVGMRYNISGIAFF